MINENKIKENEEEINKNKLNETINELNRIINTKEEEISKLIKKKMV